MEVDGVNGCIKALNQTKKANDQLKTVLSIGGGGQGSSHYPAVAQNEYTRQVFSKSVKDMVDIHGFDGVDSMLHSLKLPCCRQPDCISTDLCPKSTGSTRPTRAKEPTMSPSSPRSAHSSPRPTTSSPRPSKQVNGLSVTLTLQLPRLVLISSMS